MRATHTLWLAALIAALLIPFLLVDVPPVLDYPNQLARWFVLGHTDDPILSHFYAPNWHLTPNLGFDPLGVALVKLLPVHVAGRIVLALSLLAPVLGALLYAKAAFGKWTVWPLGVSLIGFNGIFFLGFVNFLLATGLAFAAAGLWLWLRRQGRDRDAVLMGAAASALIFLCHIFGVALFALLIGAQEIAQPRSGLPRWLLPRCFRRWRCICSVRFPAMTLQWPAGTASINSGICSRPS